MEYVNLRPHHFLCIPGYKGEGYSTEFKLNMEKVIDSLYDGKMAKITLGKDDICKHCLNPESNICSSKFVENVDHTVMNLLGLKEGDVVDFEEKLGILKNTVTPEYHKEVCNECIWMLGYF